MELLFRVWRFIILLVLGSFFLVELAAIVAPDWLGSVRNAGLALARPGPAKPADALALAPLLLLALAVVGAFGFFLLDVAAAGLGRVLRRMAGTLGANSFIESLTEPYSALALRYLRAHSASLIEHFDILDRSLAEFDFVEQKMAAFRRSIADHATRPDLDQLIEPASFHHVVTQDQFRMERMKDEIASIADLWIVAPLLPIAELQMGACGWVPGGTALAAAVLLACTLPALADRRRRLSAIIMVGYLTAFEYGRGVEVADRSM